MKINAIGVEKLLTGDGICEMALTLGELSAKLTERAITPKAPSPSKPSVLPPPPKGEAIFMPLSHKMIFRIL